MNQKVRTGGGTVVSLTDRHYKAAGGEASIYVNGATAYKLYHEPKKKMLPPNKMAELSKIGNHQVIVPQEVLYNATTGEPIGYTTKFITDAHPLLKFFTRTFKDENSVSASMIAELVKQMQHVVTDVHAAKCLVVDLNELNVLVKINSGLEPFFIDTDSYATPSFRATAIMDSVRDRRVSIIKGGQLAYNPDVLSDWFSWGILAFWLYTNIHPFRGSHPNYKPKDKGKQMDDGISVFHKGVRVPPTVNDFSVIPKRHLEWFKSVFHKNERSEPPLPDVSAPIAVPASVIMIQGTDKIDVTESASYPDTILAVFNFLGVTYVITKSHVFAGNKELFFYGKTKKLLLAQATDGTVIAASHQVAGVPFSSVKTPQVTFWEIVRGVEVGTIAGTDMFARNGCIYTVANGKMVENSFTLLGNKVVHRICELENISNLTATVYDGCVVQDLLGKKYLTIPYAKGRSFSKHIPQLDGFRIVGAKSEKNVTVFMAEHGGIYHRFIVMFDAKYQSFDVRETKDVAYDAINFTVLENGVCLLLASPSELEIFTSTKHYETLNDPPFDSTMKLFNSADGTFFINGNSIHRIQRK